MEIKRSKPNALKELTMHLTELHGTTGKVGWFESAVYEDGTPVAYAASLNEFGHGPTPPRLGMRTTAEAKQTEWKELGGKLSLEVLMGRMSAFEAMDAFTMKVESDISKHIASVTTPPLSPITIYARAMKHKGEKITGKTIGIIAATLRNQSYEKTMAYIAGTSTKPLIDTRLMFDTLTHIVEKK